MWLTENPNPWTNYFYFYFFLRHLAGRLIFLDCESSDWEHCSGLGFKINSPVEDLVELLFGDELSQISDE